MRYGVFGAVFGLAIFAMAPLSANPAAARSTEPAVPDRGDITLFQSSGRVLVMMRIGEGELVPMVFDTGSDGHSIDRLIVDRDHLKRVGSAIEVDGTTGKQRTLPLVALDNVTIGGLKVKRIEATALDYDRNDAMGIISSEMFTAASSISTLARAAPGWSPGPRRLCPQSLPFLMCAISPASTSSCRMERSCPRISTPGSMARSACRST